MSSTQSHTTGGTAEGSSARVRRALVATDGSDAAVDAARQALALLDESIHLTLVTVMPETLWPEDTAGGFEGPLLTEEEAEEQAEEDSAEAELVLAKTARLASLGDAERMSVTGEAGPALCDLAAELHADLIVVGSERKGILRRVLVGSASRYVLDHAPCPVLVVRHDH
jgi:nucleotide-binding universal stress UspA family protein